MSPLRHLNRSYLLNNDLLNWLRLLIKIQNGYKGDFLEIYGFMYHHVHLGIISDDSLILLAKYLGKSFPKRNTRVKLIKWADWIAKDDSLIAAQGLQNLSHWELIDAAKERGFVEYSKSPVELLKSHFHFMNTLKKAAMAHRKRIGLSGDLEIRDMMVIGIILLLRNIGTDNVAGVYK
jgi:hypothetical protein